jgi:hypothetical protein
MLSHLASFLISIYKAFHHPQTKLFFYLAIGGQGIMCILYSVTFNKGGYIESSMMQSATNFMLLLLIVMLYFTDWLNYDYDMSYFIEGKNTIDCIIYSFNPNPGLHCY